MWLTQSKITRKVSNNYICNMDPLTASLLFQGAGALIKGFGDSAAAKKSAEFQQGLSDEAKALMPGLQKKVDAYSIGPSMRKLRQMANEDPLGDLARQDLERTQATSVEALKSGGAKSLFALSNTLGGIDRSRRQIDADAFGRMRSALATVGQAEENVNKIKFHQDAKDLASARSQALGYKLGAFGQKQAGRDARLGLLTSGLDTMGSLAASGAFGDGKTMAADGSGLAGNIDFGSPEPGTFSKASETPTFASLANKDFMEGYSGLNQNNSPFSEGYDFGFEIPQFGSAPNLAAGIYRGRAVEYAKGGRTKGSFSHDTNDMKIVDKNGKPTGMSVTGNEVVLTPDQQKKVLEQSSYFRSLMKTPNFR